MAHNEIRHGSLRGIEHHNMMHYELGVLDVDYEDNRATCACVLAHHWTDDVPAWTAITHTSVEGDYRPGAFFQRELPPLLATIGTLAVVPDTLIIDGYVWLSSSRPGLGYHLYEALERSTAVIGVAKNPFKDNDAAVEVRRGASNRPLYVTSIGTPIDVAAKRVLDMHGAFRIPTLLKLTDQACRVSRADSSQR